MASLYHSTGTAVGGTGDITVAWPSHATDDIGLLIVECSNTGSDSEPSVTGWTKLFTEVVGVNSRLTVFWKAATSGAMADVTVPDTGDHSLAKIVVWRGPDTADPINSYATGVKSTASTSGSIAGVTADYDGNDVLYITSWPNDLSTAQMSGESNANLTGLTEIFDGGTTQGNGGGLAGWKGNLATAGSTGTLTYTLAGSRQEIYCCIAFKTATAATDITPQDATHSHAAEAPGLSVAASVASSDASHSHAAESPGLSVAVDVASQDATHGHAAESPGLSVAVDVASSDALHGHAAENTTIVTGAGIAPDDATHAHAAESLALSIQAGVTVADALHGHAAESPGLSVAVDVAVEDALHGHAAENATIIVVYSLASQDALHGHAAENTTITYESISVIFVSASVVISPLYLGSILINPAFIADIEVDNG